LQQKGAYDEAIREAERVKALGFHDGPAYLCHALAVAGRKVEALRVLDELSVTGGSSPYSLATIHTALGNKDEAFRRLEQAYDQRFPLLSTIRVDPAFDNLRSDPRYTDLIRRLRLGP
jgi:hypothetical protein